MSSAEAKEATRELIMDALLAANGKDAPGSAKEVAARLGLSVKLVYAELKVLGFRGLVAPAGHTGTTRPAKRYKLVRTKPGAP